MAKWDPQYEDQFWSPFCIQSWVKTGSIWRPCSGHPISKLLAQAPRRGSQKRVAFGTCSRAAGMRQVREGCQKSLVRGPWVGSQKRPILAPPLEEPAEYCRRCRSPEGVPFWSLILTQKYALGGPKTEPPKGPLIPIIIEMPFSGGVQKGTLCRSRTWWGRRSHLPRLRIKKVKNGFDPRIFSDLPESRLSGVISRGSDPLPHAPGARMTVVTLTPSNNNIKVIK